MNAREQRFCEEYLVDLNACGAAKRAGYRPKTAANAYQWLKAETPRFKPALLERIEAMKAERARRTGIAADRVVREYASIAFANIADITDGEQLLENPSRDDMAAVASIKVKRGSGGSDCDVRMYDKLKALDMLGRHLGMFSGEAEGAPAGDMPRVTIHPDGSVTIDGGER